MTVAELIAQLQELPQGHTVVLAMDPEGNHFYELSDLGIGHYTGDGEFLDEAPTETYDGPGDPAVCLWP